MVFQGPTIQAPSRLLVKTRRKGEGIFFVFFKQLPGLKQSRLLGNSPKPAYPTEAFPSLLHLSSISLPMASSVGQNHKRTAHVYKHISISNLLNTYQMHDAEYRARGNWNELKGKMKMAYGDLSDDDLTYDEGQEDEWFGKLQQKIGKGKAELKSWIDSL
jgi:uncharacterized protein YjbJ (UPF0337 family)